MWMHTPSLLQITLNESVSQAVFFLPVFCTVLVASCDIVDACPERCNCAVYIRRTVRQSQLPRVSNAHREANATTKTLPQ